MDEQPLTRRQRRLLERQQRQQQQQRGEQRKKAGKIVGWMIGLVLIAGSIYGLIKLGGTGPTKEDLSPFFKGTFAKSQGADHIAEGAWHDSYNTNPPTSGPHYQDTVPLGVYDEPQPDERLIHNLEHGHIWVSYNCPEGCVELVDQLKGVAQRYSLSVLTPRKENPQRICLAAWEYYDCFDEFDEKRMEAFFQQRENKGPEKLPPGAHKRK